MKERTAPTTMLPPIVKARVASATKLAARPLYSGGAKLCSMSRACRPGGGLPIMCSMESHAAAASSVSRGVRPACCGADEYSGVPCTQHRRECDRHCLGAHSLAGH